MLKSLDEGRNRQGLIKRNYNTRMHQAFVKEPEGGDDDLEFGLPPIPPGTKNYMIPALLPAH